MQDTPGYPEDETILDALEDPVDVEAFTHLMENAYREGVSAADFIREEPKRTSRKAIRKLCLKDRKRSLRAMVSNVVRSMWDRPAKDPETALENLFSAPPPPRRFGTDRSGGENDA